MNVSPVTVQALAAAGYDIARVSDALPVTAADTTILTHARRHGSVIITQDMDFSALLALGGHAKPSVISLRMSSADPALAADRLLSLIPRYEGELAKGCAISVGDDACRVRMLPVR